VGFHLSIKLAEGCSSSAPCMPRAGAGGVDPGGPTLGGLPAGAALTWLASRRTAAQGIPQVKQAYAEEHCAISVRDALAKFASACCRSARAPFGSRRSPCICAWAPRACCTRHPALGEEPAQNDAGACSGMRRRPSTADLRGTSPSKEMSARSSQTVLLWRGGGRSGGARDRARVWALNPVMEVVSELRPRARLVAAL